MYLRNVRLNSPNLASLNSIRHKHCLPLHIIFWPPTSSISKYHARVYSTCIQRYRSQPAFSPTSFLILRLWHCPTLVPIPSVFTSLSIEIYSHTSKSFL